MGGIVFSTIAENIKSFFTREETLLAKPKAAPEAASEALEHGAQHQAVERIVERLLPTSAPPFRPEQLRAALAKQNPPRTAVPIVEEREISHEIDAFEDALQDVPQEVVARPQASEQRTVAPAPRESAFDAYDRLLLEEGEAGIDKDVLHRLREFHQHQRDGQQYYFSSRDAKAAMARKIAELKLLEREWLGTRDEMDDLERGLAAIEHEIEERSRELRDLLAQAKSTTRLERAAPPGQEFVLRDGRRLGSLLDLRVALRTMPEDVFRHHVGGGRHDFSTWTRSALREPAIADAMAGITDRHGLAAFLSKAGI